MTHTTAQGVSTVNSYARPECHAPSGFKVNSYSGANGARARATAQILDYWQHAGILRTSCPRNQSCPEYARTGRCDFGGMHVRDLVNPELASRWYPLAARDAAGRRDRAELSHVISSANGGAYCGCNALPEVGALNAARGNADMVLDDLTESARDLLAGWPSWWLAHRARAASKARLARS